MSYLERFARRMLMSAEEHPEQPERPDPTCHVCGGELATYCESCDAPICEEHAQCDTVSGAWFCGMREDAGAYVMRTGDYDGATLCRRS